MTEIPGKIRRPRLTQRVIEGIIAATSEHLAGDMGQFDVTDQDDILLADQWARAMRTWTRSRGQWKESE